MSHNQLSCAQQSNKQEKLTLFATDIEGLRQFDLALSEINHSFFFRRRGTYVNVKRARVPAASTTVEFLFLTIASRANPIECRGRGERGVKIALITGRPVDSRIAELTMIQSFNHAE